VLAFTDLLSYLPGTWWWGNNVNGLHRVITQQIFGDILWTDCGIQHTCFPSGATRAHDEV